MKNFNQKLNYSFAQPEKGSVCADLHSNMGKTRGEKGNICRKLMSLLSYNLFKRPPVFYKGGDAMC